MNPMKNIQNIDDSYSTERTSERPNEWMHFLQIVCFFIVMYVTESNKRLFPDADKKKRTDKQLDRTIQM